MKAELKIAQIMQKQNRFSNFRQIKYQRDKRIIFSYPADKQFYRLQSTV